nr:hypothetical protein [uncultured Pseudomonas sp.]
MFGSEFESLVKNAVKGKGEFSAFVDGKKFLDTKNVYYHGDWVVGNDGNKDYVVFSFVPSKLEGDGPHDVLHPEGSIQWDVLIENRKYPVKSGSAQVNFSDGRARVFGTINFVLETGQKVTGSYNISK